MKQAYTYWNQHIRGTLRFRFATWIAGVLCVILIAFSIFIYIRVSQNLIASVDQGLQASAGQFASVVEVEYGTLEMPSENVVDLGQNTNLAGEQFSFILIDAQGKRLGGLGNGPRPKLSDANLEAALAGDAVAKTINQDVRIYVTPIIDNGQVMGVLYVTRSLADVQETLRSLLLSLVLSIPMLILLAGTSGYYLAKQALEPISTITETARQLSATDLSARLNFPHSNDEVGRLAETFDDMLNRLDEAFQRERQFTADASHELRTPVMALQTILDVIQMRERSPEQYKDALTDLSQETDKLRALLTSLLMLARGDRTWLHVEERIDLTDITHATVNSLRVLAQDKGLALHTTIGNRLLIPGNQEGIERVVTNLIENAIKYTETGEVRVFVQYLNDSQVEFKVSDTGIGIAEEHIEHIFERFYRVEQSRTTKGTGLGLSLVKQIVDAHNGTITVGSRPGEGTTFTVTLPAPKQQIIIEQHEPEGTVQGQPRISTS